MFLTSGMANFINAAILHKVTFISKGTLSLIKLAQSVPGFQKEFNLILLRGIYGIQVQRRETVIANKMIQFSSN